MNVVIIGSTGLVGSILLDKLLNDNDVTKVISVGRKPLGIVHDKLTHLVFELSDLTKRRSELRGEIYFCCLGTTIKNAGGRSAFKKVDYQAVLDFAQIAKDHKATTFVTISSKGANLNSAIFYNKVKGQMEHDLQKLGIRRVVIFRPSLLMGDRHESRSGEMLAQKVVGVLDMFLNKKLKSHLATDAKILASKMLVEGKISNKESSIIESSEIL